MESFIRLTLMLWELSGPGDFTLAEGWHFSHLVMQPHTEGQIICADGHKHDLHAGTRSVTFHCLGPSRVILPHDRHSFSRKSRVHLAVEQTMQLHVSARYGLLAEVLTGP